LKNFIPTVIFFSLISITQLEHFLLSLVTEDCWSVEKNAMKNCGRVYVGVSSQVFAAKQTPGGNGKISQKRAATLKRTVKGYSRYLQII